MILHRESQSETLLYASCGAAGRFLSMFLPEQEHCPRRELHRKIRRKQEYIHNFSLRDDEVITPANSVKLSLRKSSIMTKHN